MSVRAAGTMAPTVPGVFATSRVAAEWRVELWEAHNAAALVGLDVQADRALEATEVNVQLAQARVARVSGSAHRVERSTAVIGRSPAESVAVYLTLRGDAGFAWPGGRYRLRPGDALVCETDRPFSREFPRGLAELVVTVPRAALAERTGVSGVTDPVRLSFGAAGRQHARALARIAGRATRRDRPFIPDESTVLDLVAVLAGGRDAGRGTAHRAAARAYVEEHLSDPGLGADEIAAAIGLSERQLSRVFAADGTSVPRYVLSRRLELAYAMLAGPAPALPGRSGGEESVAEVAARCGFTSASYFSHMFRKRYGLRAGDLRRGACLAE